jgi:hypothetical protein
MRRTARNSLLQVLTAGFGTRLTVFGAAVTWSGYRGTFLVTMRLAACKWGAGSWAHLLVWLPRGFEQSPPRAISLTPDHRLDLRFTKAVVEVLRRKLA